MDKKYIVKKRLKKKAFTLKTITANIKWVYTNLSSSTDPLITHEKEC